MSIRRMSAPLGPGALVLLGLSAALAAPGIDVRRANVMVDGHRPIAGERSRWAVGPGGEIAFTFTVVAGPYDVVPLGHIGPDGRIRLDAVSCETTWNVEGWGTSGWPFDLAFAGRDDLRIVTRHHGRPYGVDYWHRVGDRWTLETFGQGVTFGGNNVALGILPDKQPIVLSLDHHSGWLRVWRRSKDATWSSAKPAELSGVAHGDFDLGVGRDGRPTVVFCRGNGPPRWATRGPDGRWTAADFDDAGAAMMVALATDAAGRHHVAYAAGAGRDALRELRCASQNADGTWRVRTVADAPAGRHVGRTDIAAAAGTLAIAWELGPGATFKPKDYGNKVGGVMLTILGADGTVATHELVAEHAGRPSVALTPDGKAAYVGVYTGNDRGDDFYVLACGLAGAPAPPLAPPSVTPPQLFARGCLSDINSGNPKAVRRGIERIDMSQLRDDQRNALIPRFLDSEDFEARAHAARELARSADALVRLADRIPTVLADPNATVRHRFLAHLDSSPSALKAAMPHVVAALAGADATNRLGAADVLRKHLSAADAGALGEAVGALARDLGSRDRVRRGSAGMALEYLGDAPSAVAAVRRALASPDPLAKVYAALVLWRWGRPVDVGRLADVAGGKDEDAQLALCGLLGQVRSISCVPLLTTALKADSPAVRASAVHALRSIAMLADLKAVAKHPKGFDLLALRMTGEGTPDAQAASAAAADALIEALDHADPTVRKRACDALGRCMIAAAVPALTRRFDDPDPATATAARTAVGVIRGRPGNEFLLNLDQWRQQAATRPRHTLNPVFRKPTAFKDDVIQASGDKQLFVDDFVIDSTERLVRRVHPFRKHPRNPVFEAQVPWEEGWADPFMSTVLYDPDERAFKLWYRCGPRHSLAGYAVSADGVHWQRPDIAFEPWQDNRHHNLLGFEGRIAIWQRPGRNVIRRPEIDPPHRRYSSYFYSPPLRRYMISTSPDGIRWTQPQQARGAHGDVVSLVWDPGCGRYLLFPKYMRRSDGFVRRSFGAVPIETMTATGPMVYPFIAGLRHDAHVADGAVRAFGSLLPDTLRTGEFHTEIYSVTAIPYEGVVVALYDFWPVIGSREGPLDMPMKVSRDMMTFSDVDFPARALAIGRFGEWDSGMVYGGNTMVVVNDEIRLYYLGANMGHCTRVLPMTRPYHAVGVGLATLRLDGFASMHADQAEGVLTTKPMVLAGKELRVNAACPGGSLRVEVLDADGKPLAGFTRADAEVFAGDELRHVVRWRGRADIAPLAGRTVRLRFHLRNGDLYAFVAR